MGHCSARQRKIKHAPDPLHLSNCATDLPGGYRPGCGTRPAVHDARPARHTRPATPVQSQSAAGPARNGRQPDLQRRSPAQRWAQHPLDQRRDKLGEIPRQATHPGWGYFSSGKWRTPEPDRERADHRQAISTLSMHLFASRQRGVALLLILFLVLGVGISVFLSAWNSYREHLVQREKTQQALQQAKDAIIGYAAAHKTKPGYLSCPEQLSLTAPTEGQAGGNCTGASNTLGRFPWSSLKLDKTIDGSGEPLWYAVSSGFGSSSTITSNSTGNISIDGIANAAVAVIIAPGPPLPGQTRTQVTPSTPPLAANYLDSSNSGGLSFVSSTSATPFNDQIITITKAELFKAVNLRVLAEIRGLDDQGSTPPIYGLRGYYNLAGNQFPWAATNTSNGNSTPNISNGYLPYSDLNASNLYSGSSWLSAWFPLVQYARATTGNSAVISIGSATLTVSPCTATPCP